MKRKVKGAITVVVEIILFIAIILLLAIDKLVNGTLYNYGLVFSQEWSFQYEVWFNLSIVLLVILMFLIPIVIMTQLDE